MGGGEGKKFEKQKCGNFKETKAQIKATLEPYYFIGEIPYEKEQNQ
jgi:hypothetical protein